MTTINKPLPHRPFSLAADPEKALRRQHTQVTSVSNLRQPYVLAHDKFTVPPVPKRNHLVTRSPSPPYHLAVAPTATAATSDTLPSSRPRQPPHSFSQSQSRSNPHSSTSNLVPAHLKPTRTHSFWRRHWFVILICFLALLGISVAVGVVLVVNRRRGNPDAGVYIPPSLSSSLSSIVVPISEAPPIGTASLGSATSSIAKPIASALTTQTVPGPLPSPSATPSKPS